MGSLSLELGWVNLRGLVILLERLLVRKLLSDYLPGDLPMTSFMDLF